MSRLRKPLAAPRDRARQRGFTIIEALIATAILSAAVSVIFAVHSNAMLAAQLSSERARARLHLESLLAETGAEAALAVGERSGAFDDGYAWRVRVAPHAPAGGPAPATVRAVEVTVSVDWRSRGAARSLSLTTLRLAGAPP